MANAYKHVDLDELFDRKPKQYIQTPNQENMPHGDYSHALQRLAESPAVNAVLGAGDALSNMMRGTASLLPGVNLPKIQTGEGTAYNVGNIAGNIGGFLGGGELLDAARGAASALPYVGRAAEWLGGQGLGQGIARRTLGSAVGGLVENPENKMEGAERGALMNLLFESLPAGLKGISKAAEYFKPQKFTNQIMEEIAKAYEKATGKAEELYQPLLDKFGNKNIHEIEKIKKEVPSKIVSESGKPFTTSVEESKKHLGNYESVLSDVKDSFTPNILKLHKDYFEEPNVQNAHELQSQMGFQIDKLRGNRDPASIRDKENLQYAQKALREDILYALGKNGGQSAAEQYKKGINVMRNEVGQFRTNPTVLGIAERRVEGLDPQELLNSLTAMKEKKFFNKDHMLNDIYKTTKENIGKGRLGSDIAGMIGGGALGMLFPAPGSSVLGGIIGKALGPHAVNIAAHPAVEEFLSKLAPLYRMGQKSFIAPNLEYNK